MTLYSVLDMVKAKPGMFGVDSAESIAQMIGGYQMAVSEHQIVDEDLDRFNAGFADWVRQANPILFSYQNTRQLKILVDSGADFCLMPKQLGIDLGYGVGTEEVMSKAEGVGGAVNYVLRKVDISIDSHTLMVPIAWLQTDDTVECLLGREVVFDNFDIEFKQRDRQIIFKYRDVDLVARS